MTLNTEVTGALTLTPKCRSTVAFTPFLSLVIILYLNFMYAPYMIFLMTIWP